jgi:molybdopterin-synthase adenylyltransferase
MELVMSAIEFRRLHAELLSYAPEEGAAFLATEVSGDRLVVRSSRVFARHELEATEFGELSLTEEAQISALADLKRRRHGVVEVHTHPGSKSRVGFSPFDREQLPQFARYVRNKLRASVYGALVLGEAGYAGVAVSESGDEPVILRLAGEASLVPAWARAGAPKRVPRHFDRQLRALGPDGQARLASLRVGVVGLGGTGSLVAQQLAHLGVAEVVLVDDDRVEATNLPRLAGAAWWDPLVRRRKTANARRLFRRVSRRTRLAALGSLRSAAALTTLHNVDVIIGCVDNDGARLLLCELAAAHLVPYLDIGVGIEPSPDGTSVMGGRVAFYLPSGPCVACADELDFGEAAEDLESESLRRVRIERGYARDRRVEAALMPLNSAVASLAMMELLAFATAVRHVVPFSRYDAVSNRLVAQRVDRDHDCPVCGPASGMGDRQAVHRYAVDDKA